MILKSCHLLRYPEKLQCLVNQMRAEIEPEPAARNVLFTPSLTRLGAVAIVVRFEINDFAERLF